MFGPVLAITRFETDEEVLEQANDTEFGLAAGVWTNDIRRAHSMARALQAGTVWINTYRALAFNSPFGGYRSSGTGRNNGIESINQYLQTKSVWCRAQRGCPGSVRDAGLIRMFRKETSSSPNSNCLRSDTSTGAAPSRRNITSSIYT